VKTLVMFLMVTMTITACGSATSGSQIEQITSIPPDEVMITPTATLFMTAESADVTASAATPTPLNINLPQGSAMEAAAATDAALRPTPRTRLSFDESPVPIAFSEFYDGYNMRTGLVLSDKLVSLDGQQIVIEGYMAPPLKPELDYFVLTRIRLQFCPFCSTAADWPDDIALVYLPEETTTATEYPVRVIGRIEVGTAVDVETGMVSLVRIYADEMEILN